MAIIASDSFAGMAVDDPLWNLRTLPNNLGGSGTRTWNSVSGSYIGSDGAGYIYYRGVIGRALVPFSASLDAQQSTIIRFTAAASVSLVGRMAAFDGSDFTSVRATMGTSGGLTSLLLQTVDSANSTTTVASATISALSTGTDYLLVLRIVGSTAIALIYNAAGTVLLGSTAPAVSIGTKTGTYWGLQYPGDNSAAGLYKNFIIEDPPVVAASWSNVFMV